MLLDTYKNAGVKSAAVGVNGRLYSRFHHSIRTPWENWQTRRKTSGRIANNRQLPQTDVPQPDKLRTASCASLRAL